MCNTNEKILLVHLLVIFLVLKLQAGVIYSYWANWTRRSVISPRHAHFEVKKFLIPGPNLCKSASSISKSAQLGEDSFLSYYILRHWPDSWTKMAYFITVFPMFQESILFEINKSCNRSHEGSEDQSAFRHSISGFCNVGKCCLVCIIHTKITFLSRTINMKLSKMKKASTVITP